MFKFVLKRLLNYFVVVFLVFCICGCELLEDRNSKITDVCEKFSTATMNPDTPPSERLDILYEILELDFTYTMEMGGTVVTLAGSRQLFLETVSTGSVTGGDDFIVESTGPYNISMNTASSDSEKATVNLYFNFDITIDVGGGPMAFGYIYTTELHLKNKNSLPSASNWKIYKWAITDITIVGSGISSISSTLYIPYIKTRNN